MLTLLDLRYHFNLVFKDGHCCFGFNSITDILAENIHYLNTINSEVTNLSTNGLRLLMIRGQPWASTMKKIEKSTDDNALQEWHSIRNL